MFLPVSVCLLFSWLDSQQIEDGSWLRIDDIKVREGILEEDS